MENGLGRTGYLLLATIMLVLGLLGIGAAYLAYLDGSERFFELGLGLAAVAILGMFGFAAYAPWLSGPSRVPRKATAAPKAPAAPSTPAVANVHEDIGFEYTDAAPAAKAAPESLVVPKPFLEMAPTPTPYAARDPAAWPERRNQPSRPAEKSDWTMRVEREAKAAEMLDASKTRKNLQERYTEDTPTVRGILQDPPMHVAERAPEGLGPGFTAPGMTVGQCGRCKTVVMAPDRRPLRLKCPECAKVTLLN